MGHYFTVFNLKPYLNNKYIFVLFIILILSTIDGYLTIVLLENGAWEANPIMRYTLSVSNEFFIFIKYFITAGGLLFLLKNGDKSVFRGLFLIEEIVYLFVLMYEGLVIYELTLYNMLV